MKQKFNSIFTKFHTQVRTSPRKSWLDFQGHGSQVKVTQR